MINLDDIVFKSGYFDKVPADVPASLLAAGLYEDVEGRMFKRRWSNPEEEMPDSQLHFFSVAYHKGVPVGVAYGAMNKEYTLYELPGTKDHYALNNGTLGVYVNPDYRGLGMAHGMTLTVLKHMKDARGDEKPGTRMALNARRFCAYIVNCPDVAKDFITVDELHSMVCGES